jgi:hypothetical protein
MVFKIDDIYTSSGSVKLFNSWTPYVSKFDTSSFYNWEQDNLPLYDIEERTYEMWEQGGFPTSAAPGLALTVSADTPITDLQADSTIFTNVSSCMAAIPKVVRFPVLVEVCNFGDMGKLELHNIRIEEGGSIEVINRAYSRVYNASATVKNVANFPTYNRWTGIVNRLQSADVSATLLSGISQNDCTSGVNIKTRVFDGTNFTSRASAVYSCLYPKSDLRKGGWGKSGSQYWPTSRY